MKTAPRTNVNQMEMKLIFEKVYCDLVLDKIENVELIV